MPKRALETARETGRYEAEGWRVRKDGTRFWASVVIDAIHDEQGELIGFAKITRDMTEKREAQLRLEESREQLFQSQKMEALGQLTGGLAHDFNNLLTAILGASELALRNLDNPEKLKRMLDGVRGSAQRGAGLTKQLLAFARAQQLEIKQIDLKPFFAEVTTLVRPSLRSNIELVIEISDQFWPVDADAGALELALLNLAFNARDAMKDGGKLKISAHNVVLNGQPEGLTGEHVALTVSDTGTGMIARGDGARVRAILHHQGLWRGHRAWASARCSASPSRSAAGSRSKSKPGPGRDLHALPAGEPRRRVERTARNGSACARPAS